MKSKKIRAIGTGVLLAVWGILTLCGWFLPDKSVSESERRELEQMPELSVSALLDGSFMSKFESYALDQFPLRDDFRTVKSLFHYNALGQKDNNHIYIAQGYAAKQEYPLDSGSVDYAVGRFTHVYDKYLSGTDCRAYMAIVPDKGYYLASESGQLALDYEKMFTLFREEMPWATHIDLTGSLNARSYYRTDTHWRQETLLPAATALCDAMGAAAPRQEDFTQVAESRPFYGVYYGQAALPLDAETLYTLESDGLKACVTYEGQWDLKEGPVFRKLYDGVYDREKATGKDMYELFLSGSLSMLRIENPNATTTRELVVFRDSFGSSIAPLLTQGYAAVTLVDIRYLNSDMVGQFITFDDQDVLFLYSTLVLNNSTTLK